MPNVFDQFDAAQQEQKSAPNVFDQFDGQQTPGFVEEPAKQSGGLLSGTVGALKDAIFTPARNAISSVSDLVTGANRSEDYPEMLRLTEQNPEMARTPEGKVNLIRKEFPKAALAGQDKYGNPLVTLGEDRSGILGNVSEANQKYYINKPGLSFGDINTIKAGYNRAIIPVAASATMGPAGWVMASPAVGASGVVSEGLNQAIANRQGADEGYSGGDMLKMGAAASLGEGGGRVVSWALGQTLFKLLGQNPGKLMTATGQLNDDAVKALKDAGITPEVLSAEFQKAMQEGIGKGLTPNQAMTHAASKNVGAKLTSGQITRDMPQLRAEEIAFQSPNPLVREQLAAQRETANRALTSYADDFITGTGGIADDLTAGASTKGALRSKLAEAKAATGEAYKQADEALKGKDVDLSSVAGKVRELEDFATLSPELEVIKKTLARFGVTDDATKPLTGEQANIVTQRINQLYEGASDQSKAMVLRPLKESIDEAVGKAAGADSPYQAARATAAAWHAEFSQKDIIDAIVKKKAQYTEAIPDEQVVKKLVFSGSLDDLYKAKRSLSSGSKEQIEKGTEAWNNIRATTFRNLIDDSMNPNVKNEAGDIVFSGAKFQTLLNKKIGDDKLRVLFSPKELESIHSIRLVADALTNNVRGSINTSYTSTFLRAMEKPLRDIPGGKYLVDILKRPMVNRALSDDLVTETARKDNLGSRIAPKVSVGGSQQDR